MALGRAVRVGVTVPVALQLLAQHLPLLSVMTVKSRATPVTPSTASSAVLTRCWISLRSGQPATVSAMSTQTDLSLRLSTLRTMSRSTIERCSSGSSTGRRASIRWSTVAGIVLLARVGRNGDGELALSP